MPSALRLLGEPAAPAKAAAAWCAKGFRPFFLAASLCAAALMPLWLLALAGHATPSAYLEPATWHAHEMLFGFAVAVIAGFLLTAVGNWTGRETAVGAPLVALVALWALGRAAFVLAGVLPPVVVAAVDLAFLPALALAIGRPLVAARNVRNYVMLGVLSALFAANVAVHLDALGVLPGVARRAHLAALDLVTLLIVVVSARIFPMFTRNATGHAPVRSVPALDRAAATSMAALVAVDLALPGHVVAALLAASTSALLVWRSATWGAWQARKVPLVWILHAAHGWIAAGLALRAASAWTPLVPASAATHALTAGAIGAATLGMMARVALGHTGRLLEVRAPVTVAFVLVTLAAAVRVAGPFVAEAYRPALFVAGVLWTAAFALYVAVYARVLVSPRVDGKPG